MAMPARTADQIARIVALIKEGRTNDEIANITGEPRGSISAFKANWTRGAYGDIDDEDSTNIEEIDTAKILKSAEKTIFRIELDMQNALRRHIDQLESGLTIIDEGKEKIVSFGGKIDITARDKIGSAVVIELKAGPADQDAIAQILSYMGALGETEQHVRGILVAGDFSLRAISAARAVPNIRLLKYTYTFSFEPIGAVNAAMVS